MKIPDSKHPLLNIQLNLVLNPRLNPLWNIQLNLDLNATVNPVPNARINSLLNAQLSPLLIAPINPALNRAIHSASAPDAPVAFLFDAQLRLCAFGVYALDAMWVLFDTDTRHIGIAVPISDGVYLLFDQANGGIGFLATDDQGRGLCPVRYLRAMVWHGGAIARLGRTSVLLALVSTVEVMADRGIVD